MIVAVPVVRVMQVAIYQVVHMITMGDSRMTTIRAVHMVLVMAMTIVCSAAIRIGSRNLNDVFVIVALMCTM